MKFKATWITLAVFGALAAYLAFVDEPRHQAAKAAKGAEGLVFPGFAVDQATSLTLQGAWGRVRVTRGEDGRWMVEEPWRDRADDSRVRALLQELVALKAKAEVVGAGAELAPFGLVAPNSSVEVGGAGLTLAVGARNPAGDAHYVRAGVGAVLLVAADGLTALLGESTELRDKELLEGFPWDGLRAVEVRRSGSPALRLVREGDTWALAAPVRGEADPDAVNRVVEKLRWARVTRFLDLADRARLGGGTEVLLTAEGPPVTLRFAEVEGEVWATRSGREALFTLGPDVLEPFGAGPEGFRRRKPLLAKAWRVQEVELSLGAGGRRYRKGEAGWQREGADLVPAEAEALQAYLDALETSVAAEVLDAPGDYGLAVPTLTARLVDTGGREEVVRVARRGTEVYAQAAGGGPVYRMPPQYLERAEALVAPPKLPGAAAP